MLSDIHHGDQSHKALLVKVTLQAITARHPAGCTSQPRGLNSLLRHSVLLIPAANHHCGDT